MPTTVRLAWFAEENVLAAVRLEPAIVILALACLAWLVYKLLLRKISIERHQTFREHFSNLAFHLGLGGTLFGLFHLLKIATPELDVANKMLPYIGLMAVISGCTIFVKILRIMAFEFLFYTSMKAGVPLLLVNVFTLVVSLILGGWFLTRFFEVDLTPLLATSAILSIVLGLALQDTLGNLFAAISLQVDKPFELGDWIELRVGGERVAGQVQEITWRATVMLAVTDEMITIPNRTLAQGQIVNYAYHRKPFIRSHNFRIPYGGQVEMAKLVLLSAASSVPGVMKNPPPAVVISEANENWIVLKAVYSILDYGSQYGIADKFLTQALKDLNEAGIELASPRIAIENRASSSSAG